MRILAAALFFLAAPCGAFTGRRGRNFQGEDQEADCECVDPNGPLGYGPGNCEGSTLTGAAFRALPCFALSGGANTYDLFTLPPGETCVIGETLDFDLCRAFDFADALPNPPDPDDGGAMEGDPHIKTWASNWYDYHGECDLVLVDAPEFDNGDGLRIHVRTKIRYDYSHIEAAALQIGGQVLEVAGWGQYLLDGIAKAQLPASLHRYPVEYEDKSDKVKSFVVQLGGGGNITLSTFKDWVNVQVHTALPGSLGLMGEYGTGRLLARDGVTVVEDHNEFGQEWQVQPSEGMLFAAVREPQAPSQKCILPSNQATAQKRRLGESVARSAAEKACAKWKVNKANCVSDILATGDFDIADAPGAF